MLSSEKTSRSLVTVLGPTASGKTSFASQLADRLNGEIISADSRQVYRRMNLGTGKDYDDYRINGRLIPFHLIDIADPGYKYNVFEFQQDFLKAFGDITGRGHLPILCGGSGLYINAAIRGYQLLPVPPNEELRAALSEKTLEDLTAQLASMKKLHNHTDVDTKMRAIRAIEIELYYQEKKPPVNSYREINNLCLGIRYNRQTERHRITQRLQKRLAAGMVDEVRSLLDSGLSPESLVYYGLEYKYITLFLTGRLSYDAMVDQLNVAIHQFAKRQMTWFRKMEKEGTRIHWIEGELPMEEKLDTALQLMI